MKHKQTHYVLTALSVLIFLALGYLVTFTPEALTSFDTSIQSTIRGDLPAGLTTFFKAITIIGNTGVQAVIAVLAVVTLYLGRDKVGAGFVAISGALAALMIVGLKYLFSRPRPSITHLVHASGYSFPSGHSLGTFLILGAIAIVIAGYLTSKQAKVLVYALTGLIVALVGLSRIYLGVHYPTDVLAGFTMAFGLLNALYPSYDRLRKQG